MKRAGFSLTELLIVIGLIVLMIALAVPTFNFISGNRSVEGAQNTIAAFLGRARAEAIGLQETRGVLFFIERKTGRTAMTIVRETQRPTGSAGVIPLVDVFLDVTDDAEFVTLPVGVGAQFIDASRVSGTQPIDDRYIGFNVTNQGGNQPDTHTAYGGVILFDSQGRLASRTYAFKTLTGPPNASTRMGNLLYAPNGDPAPLTNHYQIVPDVVVHVYPAPVEPPRSQFGVVLFDRAGFQTASPQAGGRPADADVQFDQGAGTYAGSPEETVEEKWLDENGVPLLVNRYNGTLVKAQ
jgi:Tfp pilus assembly protein FimT